MLITFLGAAGLSLPAFGQGRGASGPTTPPAGSTTPGGSIPTGTTGRSTIPTQPNPPNQPNQGQQVNRPIFITGRVTMEDGTGPPEPVVIERVCGGSPHSEGYTDSKGYFSFELGGRNNGMVPDASETNVMRDPGGMGGAGGFGGISGMGSTTGNGGGMDPAGRYMNCELRARLAGYRSQFINLAMRRPMDDPNVGVILLHRIGSNEEGTTVSAVSLAAPKDARKAFDKARDAEKKKKPEEAMKNYQKAVEVYPKYAAAWYEIGRLNAIQGQTDAAKKSFETAVEADPKYVDPYLQLGLLAARAQNWQALAEVSDRAIKLDPFDYPQAFFFNAVANFNLKKVDVAEKSAREAERLDTRHQYPQAAHLLGVILAQRQDYPAAAEHFRNYLKFAPDASDAPAVRTQLEQIDKMTAQAGPGAAKQ
jgi:TolA-binding protein